MFFEIVSIAIGVYLIATGILKIGKRDKDK